MTNIIILIWIHWIADYVFQSHSIGSNKWKNLEDLFLHGLLYSMPFIFFGVWFMILNGLCHIIVDFVTSKITHELYEKKSYHNFFVVLGLDQAIHITIMLILLNIL